MKTFFVLLQVLVIILYIGLIVYVNFTTPKQLFFLPFFCIGIIASLVQIWTIIKSK